LCLAVTGCATQDETVAQYLVRLKYAQIQGRVIESEINEIEKVQGRGLTPGEPSGALTFYAYLVTEYHKDMFQTFSEFINNIAADGWRLKEILATPEKLWLCVFEKPR